MSLPGQHRYDGARSRAQRRRRTGRSRPSAPLGAVTAIAGATVLAGCGQHLHDPGRLQAASEAAEIAKGFSSGGTAIFEPMEKNLDGFTTIEEELAGLANTYELETFKAVVADYRASDVVFELTDTMQDWTGILGAFDRAEASAVAAVNDALARRDVVARLLTGQEQASGDPAPVSVDGTLRRLNKRLETMQANADRFLKAFDAAAGLAGPSTGEDGAATDGTSDVERVKQLSAGFETALDSIESDEQLVAARALLAATVQEQLAAESRRIAEHRRYLGEVRRLRQTFDTRERVAVCHLFLPAFYRMLAVVEDDSPLVELYETMKASGRYDSEEFCAFARIRDAQGNLRVDPGDAADWREGQATLAEYVAANVARHGTNAGSPQLVAGMAILAFVERPFLDSAVAQLDVEANRHVLRVSRINAQQRADLLRDLAASMEIYEQGGIKPEEVARLALFASQVGALFFIGANR